MPMARSAWQSPLNDPACTSAPKAWAPGVSSAGRPGVVLVKVCAAPVGSRPPAVAYTTRTAPPSATGEIQPDIARSGRPSPLKSLPTGAHSDPAAAADGASTAPVDIRTR